MFPRTTLALSLPFIALAVQWILWPWISPFAWLLFFPAVLFSARLGGLSTGMVSTVLSIGIVWYFFVPPQLDWKLVEPRTFYSALVFLVLGYLISDSEARVGGVLESRQRFVDRLDEIETKFETTFEHAAVGMVQMAPTGQFLRANRKMCQILGYSREELLDRSFTDITHPDDIQTSVAQVRSLLSGQVDSFAFEKRYIRRDGGTMWGTVSTSVVRKPDGSVAYVIAVVEDISSSKAAQEALHAAESWFRSVVESSDDAIIGKSLDGLITSWNASAESIFGYSAAEAIGQPIKMLFPPDRLDEEDYLLNQIRAGTKVSHYESERLCKDGKRIIVSITLSPIRDVSGQIIGASKIARDVTEQKRIGRALEEQNTLLRQMSALAHIGGWTFDPATREVILTDEVARIYDLPDGTAITVDAGLDYYVGGHREKVEAAVSEAINSGKSFDLEAMIRTSVGHPKWVRVVGTAAISNGTVVRVSGTLQDITARILAERHAEQTQSELFHASRLTMMGEMASRIAHEVNQPLGAVTNYLQAAQTLVAGNDQVTSILDKARLQAKRASETVRKVKSFAANREVDPHPEALRPLVEDACALALIGNLGADVVQFIDIPRSLPVVLVDRIQFQQVLVNLIRNAAEAMIDSPIKNLSLATQQSAAPNCIDLIISDTGPGVPEHISAQLFKSFVTTKKDGTGLGLSTSRALMQANGGGLEFIARPQGAAFRLTIPFAIE